jgi:hypothetical protein
LLYDYLGAKYLYTAQVGFGFTAESLKDYLHYFFGRHADDEGLTDDKIGRNMAKIISSKLRKKAESPEYQRVSLKAIAKAEGIRFVCGNIWRTLTEAFGAERIDEAARDVLTGRATEAPRGGQTRGEPSAAAPMGAAGPTGQLAERLGAETGKTGTALQFELSRRITRRVSERSRAGRLK